MTLGILAVTPGLTLAGPFSFQRKAPKSAKQQATKAPSNQQMAESVANALRNARIQGQDVDIEFNNGVVLLTGKVRDENEKVKANQIATSVAGVERVDNRLVAPRIINNPYLTATAPSASSAPKKPSFGKKPSGSDKSTSPIRKASHQRSRGMRGKNQKTAEKIASALSKAKLSGYDIEIRFKNGTVTLSGSVQTPAQLKKATKVVSKVSGVKQVDNQLKIKGRPSNGPTTAMHQQFPGGPQQFRGGPQQFPGGPQQFPGGPQNPYAGGVTPAGFQAGMGPAPQQMMPASAGGYSHSGPGDSQPVYNNPNLPETAWPTYASYPNYAQVAYPKQYSASAWPYIGPFYPYPQVPLGWRQATLEWDDGFWNLNFRPRTDRWWWFLQPKNW
jgi:osmotically-inducible protein OsmY